MHWFDRIVFWLYNHRRIIILLLCSPLLYFVWQWLFDRPEFDWSLNEEYPIYDIPPKHNDDTLRVIVIGDSWAEYHMTLECDTIFCRYAKSLTTKPVKCLSIGHSAKVTKEIYNEMFSEKTIEHSWDRNRCSQPLIELHPDYCIIMAGINDMRLSKPVDFYVGNYRLMLNLLIKNGIRPVVLEIPGVDLKYFNERRKYYRRWLFGLISLWTKVDDSSTEVYREAMKKMLQESEFKNRVLFIPASAWNPGGIEANPSIYLDDRLHLNLEGYHVLDSCMATEVIRDYILMNKQ